MNTFRFIYNIIDKDGDYIPCIINEEDRYESIYDEYKEQIDGLTGIVLERKGYKISKEKDIDKIEKYNKAYKRKEYLNKGKEHIFSYLKTVVDFNESYLLESNGRKYIEDFFNNLFVNFTYKRFEEETEFTISIGYEESFGSSFQISMRDSVEFSFSLGSMNLFEKEDNEVEQNKKKIIILLGMILNDQEELERQLFEVESKYLFPMSELDK